MKNLVVFLTAVFLIAGCTIVKSMDARRIKRLNDKFHISKGVVYDKSNLAIAKYQAKTYSLDGGELVEEYNLLFVGDLKDKQVIGDLIDYISSRHNGAEVEIEINSENSPFNL